MNLHTNGVFTDSSQRSRKLGPKQSSVLLLSQLAGLQLHDRSKAVSKMQWINRWITRTSKAAFAAAVEHT